MKIILNLRENFNVEEEMKFLSSRYGLCNVYSKKEDTEAVNEQNVLLKKIYSQVYGIANFLDANL